MTVTVTPNSAGSSEPTARISAAPSALTPYRDPLRVPPVLRPRATDPSGPAELVIALRDTWTRLHSELPPTRAWGYQGHVPGPTIEVRRGQRLRVTWTNRISGPFPVTHVDVPATLDPGGVPGRQGGVPDRAVAALPPWTVTHLHGARTNAGNDGWAENAVLPDGSQLAEYPNDQPATALWYHDHAMGITALNVQAGLAGMYLIRDEEEDALGLPGGAREIPLVIADRNLDTDPDGALSGRLLHKQGTLPGRGGTVVRPPFTGPFTTVNGTIWPHLEVSARWYRFRILNASNARIYTLGLADEHGVPLDRALVDRAVRQIGTDSGLLPEPVAIPAGGLTVAPAERVDLLVDFSVLRGRRVQFRDVAASAAPEPSVLEFRVSDEVVADGFRLPARLSGSFQRLSHDDLPAHAHRWLVITPPTVTDMPQLWEMAEVAASDVVVPSDGVVQVQLPGQPLLTLRRVARSFAETETFFVELDGWEVWNILNLGGLPLVHPIHIHLIAFQALRRDSLDGSGFQALTDARGALLGFGTTTPVRHTGSVGLDANEQGWKDVIRVGDPAGTAAHLVTVAGRFSGGTGRFLYHCHLLEHEDEGMMRPFAVAPAEVLAVAPGMGGGTPM